MLDRDDAERTEEATPRRREEARKRGNIAKSREIPAVFILMFSLLFFYLASNHYYRTFMEIFEFFLKNAESDTIWGTSLPTVFSILAQMLIPLFIMLVIIAIFSNILQFGFLFTTETLVPKFEKLNPITGIKNLISRRAFVELLKALIKMVIVGFVAYGIIKAEFQKIDLFYKLSPMQFFVYLFKISASLVFKIGILFLILSILDFAFQKWDYEQSLKMTKQEVKEELKQQEGDPLVKSRIRRVQRELAQKRMMQEVPKADVVITNPVELAVALRYDEKTMNAPKVVAKGAGPLAKRIREIARKHGIPIVENRALARMLYKMVDIGDEIPEALYKAVAEVLAFVYRTKGKAA